MKFEVLQKDMIAAMKAHDKPRKDAIATLVADVKKAAIDAGARDDITEELVDKVILKSQKTAKEQLDSCPADRQDLMAGYKFTYDVISEYAPKMMSEDEVRKIIEEKFSDVIATGNKGMIMKTVMPEFKGKADGKMINKLVSELCK